MNLLTSLIERRRKAKARRALEATLKLDPAYRERRLAQLSPERRRRYERTVRELWG